MLLIPPFTLAIIFITCYFFILFSSLWLPFFSFFGFNLFSFLFFLILFCFYILCLVYYLSTFFSLFLFDKQIFPNPDLSSLFSFFLLSTSSFTFISLHVIYKLSFQHAFFINKNSYMLFFNFPLIIISTCLILMQTKPIFTVLIWIHTKHICNLYLLLCISTNTFCFDSCTSQTYVNIFILVETKPLSNSLTLTQTKPISIFLTLVQTKLVSSFLILIQTKPFWISCKPNLQLLFCSYED